MQQQDSNALTAEHQEPENDDETQFEKSLQELRHLCSQIHHAANYCEASFLNAKQEKIVVEKTKKYICGAVVTVVDHLGSVSSNLECQLLKTNYVPEAELRIETLKQRLGTWEQYSHQHALRTFLVSNLPFSLHYTITCCFLQQLQILRRLPIVQWLQRLHTKEVPLLLYTYNCKPLLVENSTFDESSPVLPVRDGMSLISVKDQHPHFHFQESPKLKRSMLNWKMSQYKDFRSIIRRGKRTLE
ncbi:hypothetical protein ACH5RR_005983 [Cinchona calisaya]|uniref:Protein ABIL5 n=1 Tax=Cinchona calisaya TaxID=153742 RepID=A0ABD3AMS3_9GENT